MKLYLRVYTLDRMVSPYVDMLQRTVCRWNHCSIRVDDIIIHFFDDYIVPRWITPAVDNRMFPGGTEFFVDNIDNLPALRDFTNSLPRCTNFDKASRIIWYHTIGLWPKRNDCVDKCSATLTHLFNIPRCYTTPDKLVRLVDEYRKQRICREA